MAHAWPDWDLALHYINENKLLDLTFADINNNHNVFLYLILNKENGFFYWYYYKLVTVFPTLQMSSASPPPHHEVENFPIDQALNMLQFPWKLDKKVVAACN